jgi:hypothetical protein
VNAPFEYQPPRWDPTTEIFPGGPHPGMVAQMHAAREEEERRAVELQRVAAQQRANHLLLLR